MASYGEQLKNSISCPHRLIIANVWMEDAVNYAKYHLPEDTDVIMARGNTAKLLKEARLPVPVVSIPISDEELIQTLETAREFYHAEDSSIAYIGIEDTIRSVRSFLTLLHRSIRFYAVKSSQDIRDSIRQAKKDRVSVVIGLSLINISVVSTGRADNSFAAVSIRIPHVPLVSVLFHAVLY